MLELTSQKAMGNQNKCNNITEIKEAVRNMRCKGNQEVLSPENTNGEITVQN